MAKNDTRQGRPVKADAAPARPRAAVPERRVRSPAELTDTPAAPTRAAAMRLAAEVERLELELAAARSEILALAARADTDPLTGMLNRRGFERELKRALAYLKRYGASAALLYVDLDRFKTINDSHGHAAGDAVLKAVAMVISRQVRASDLVARLGGDEFVVLLWNITAVDAQTKAEIIEAAIARTTATHADTCLSIGASAGAAPLLPLDTPEAVLERADAAMYARKAARGRTRAAG
jgi:diguanylate cyclase (GGDEF)-like protein